jgi:cytochrome b
VTERKVLIWDLPVRILHWLVAACFAAAWLTAESEWWRAIHVACGYAAMAGVALRVLWGFVGSRHARFATFVHSVTAAGRYVRSLVSVRPEHWAGHNPAGGLAIVGLLVLGGATGVTGWLALHEYADGDWHEVAASAWLALVGIHLCGVAVGSVLHRENLVAAMLTGRKRADPREAIASASAWAGGVAIALAAAVGGLSLAGLL